MPNAARLNNVGTPCSCEDVHVRCCLPSCDCACGRLILAGPALATLLQLARPAVDAALAAEIDALLGEISTPR